MADVDSGCLDRVDVLVGEVQFHSILPVSREIAFVQQTIGELERRRNELKEQLKEAENKYKLLKESVRIESEKHRSVSRNSGRKVETPDTIIKKVRIIELKRERDELNSAIKEHKESLKQLKKEKETRAAVARNARKEIVDIFRRPKMLRIMEKYSLDSSCTFGRGGKVLCATEAHHKQMLRRLVNNNALDLHIDRSTILFDIPRRHSFDL